jgi:hypothetical protein
MVDIWSRSKTMSLHAAKTPRPQDLGDRELCLDCLRKPGWNVGTMAGRGPAVGGLLGRKCHIQGGLKPSPIRSHACCDYTSGVMLPSSTLKWGWRATLIFLNQNRASRHSPQESLRFAQCGTSAVPKPSVNNRGFPPVTGGLPPACPAAATGGLGSPRPGTRTSSPAGGGPPQGPAENTPRLLALAFGLQTGGCGRWPGVRGPALQPIQPRRIYMVA